MADLGAIGGNGTVGFTGGGASSGGSTPVADTITSIDLVGSQQNLSLVATLDAGVLTFSFRPTTCNQSKKHRVLTGAFGDGYEQRQGDGINTALLSFDLTFENLPEDEGDDISEFLDARGAIEAFYWTPPRGTQGLYVCTEPYRRDWNPDTDGESSISCQLRQVYEL